MGRTLNTRILRSQPLPRETWKTIQTVANAINKRFTWTCGNLSPLNLDDEEPRHFAFQSDTPSDHPVQACDFTKVAGDEWNALLVVRFMRWLSTLLPDSIVKVHDEGGYILAGTRAEASRFERKLRAAGHDIGSEFRMRREFAENGVHARHVESGMAFDIAVAIAADNATPNETGRTV